MVYAVLDAAGMVVNTVAWDGKTEWQPPEGCKAVKCPEGVGRGWSKKGKGGWTAPPVDEAGFDRAFVEGE